MFAVPPLSDELITALETAVDDRDHQEEAFALLLDHVGTWSAGEGVGTTQIRLNPDYAALMNDPSAYRGDLYRLRGILQQHARLDSPFEGTWEWFIRDQKKQPMAVYLPDSIDLVRFTDGQRIEIFARFYKRIEVIARDGKKHQYPAFVGNYPRITTGKRGSEWGSFLPVIVFFVAFLGGVFLILFLYTRQYRRNQFTDLEAHYHPESPVLDESTDLPDDSAQAMAVLHRRASE